MATCRLPTLLVAAVLGVCACPAGVMADARAHERAKRVEALGHDLGSDDPATVARAAFEAGGMYRSRAELLPSLLSALERRVWAEATDGTRVAKHLLDALIRLDAQVPMAVLERHEEPVTTATEVLILAARSGEAAHALLRRVLRRAIHGGEVGIAGIAAGNLLAAARDARLAAIFLAHVRPRARIEVLDGDRPLSGVSGGAVAGTGTACARCTIPEGFPPAVWYTLSLSGRAWQHSLVARGVAESVWYVRHEEARREFFGCHAEPRLDAAKVGLGWTATLLGTRPEDLPMRLRCRRACRWSTPGAYMAFVRGVRAEMQGQSRALLDRLVKARVLTVEDRQGVAVEPVLEIDDVRRDRRVPLPSVERDGER